MLGSALACRLLRRNDGKKSVSFPARRELPTTVTSGRTVFIPCLPSRAKVSAWARSSGRAMSALRMEPSPSSSLLWRDIVPGSSSSGFEATPPSPTRIPTSTARRSGSPTSSAFAPMRSSMRKYRPIWHARSPSRPGVGVRSRWSISITRQRAGASLAG